MTLDYAGYGWSVSSNTLATKERFLLTFKMASGRNSVLKEEFKKCRLALILKRGGFFIFHSV